MENEMGTQKVSRLILTTGIPLMLSLLINSLYNFVDSVFVSRVAEDALTALSLAAPVQVFVSALGLGNAVGLNAAISKALGEKNPGKVKRIASAAIFIADGADRAASGNPAGAACICSGKNRPNDMGLGSISCGRSNLYPAGRETVESQLHVY